MEEHFWENIRKEFPVTEEYAYFQSAGLSPMPNRVYHTVVEAYRKVNLHGDQFWMEELERSNRLRAKLGKMINTSADNIVFAHNTSTAFTFLAAALKAGHPKKFNLISLWDEFPSTHIPFEFQGIEVKFVKPVKGVYTPDHILAHADENTLGVVCSYVQYATGFRLNIQELGEKLQSRGLLFFLNATQGFPTFTMDVEAMHIDAITVSFHKWGCCAHAGTLFYTSATLREKYPNPLAGWLSVQPSKNDFIPTEKGMGYKQWKSAAQYNFGTMNFQALAGLDEAIDFMHEIGLGNIRNRILEITRYLIGELERLPLEICSVTDNDTYRSGIVLVDIPGRSQAAVEILEQQKIITSVRAGKMRISCNFFNNKEDVDRLVVALSGWLAT